MSQITNLVGFFVGEVAAVRVVAGVAVLPPTVRCHEADPDQHRRRLDEGDPGPDQDPIK